MYTLAESLHAAAIKNMWKKNSTVDYSCLCLGSFLCVSLSPAAKKTEGTKDKELRSICIGWQPIILLSSQPKMDKKKHVLGGLSGRETNEMLLSSFNRLAKEYLERKEESVSSKKTPECHSDLRYDQARVEKQKRDVIRCNSNVSMMWRLLTLKLCRSVY